MASTWAYPWQPSPSRWTPRRWPTLGYRWRESPAAEFAAETIAQSQVRAYDSARRRFRHCGAYRRIKDWRGRVVSTSLCEVRVRVPRVISCRCTPEPLDDNALPTAHQCFNECPITRLISRRRTPDLSYLCAKHGASRSYRVAAGTVSEVTGLRRPCHMTIRRDTIACGQKVEDALFLTGWNAGQRRRPCRAVRLRVTIDGTYLTAVPAEEVTKFEVVAGRVERDGTMGRRFACALLWRSMAQTLVAAALEQGGWAPQTEVEVMSDGAKDMRSLVESVAPTLSKPTLDWFHLSMKSQPARSALGATMMAPAQRPPFVASSARLRQQDSQLFVARKRGRGRPAHPHLDHVAQSRGTQAPVVLASAAETARRAASRLLEYVRKNRADIVNYNRAKRSGQRTPPTLIHSQIIRSRSQLFRSSTYKIPGGAPDFDHRHAAARPAAVAAPSTVKACCWLQG